MTDPNATPTPIRVKRPLPANTEATLAELSAISAPGVRAGIFAKRLGTLLRDAQDAVDGVGQAVIANVWGEPVTIGTECLIEVKVQVRIGEKERTMTFLVQRADGLETDALIDAPIEATVKLNEAPVVPVAGKERFDASIEMGAQGIRVGDLVKWVGPGKSALDGGPGEVVSLKNGNARVKVRVACSPYGNAVQPGEVLVFPTTGLTPA